MACRWQHCWLMSLVQHMIMMWTGLLLEYRQSVKTESCTSQILYNLKDVGKNCVAIQNKDFTCPEYDNEVNLMTALIYRQSIIWKVVVIVKYCMIWKMGKVCCSLEWKIQRIWTGFGKDISIMIKLKLPF